jgi:acyl dehydratase
VSAFSAPGATLFPRYIGESFIDFTELSCNFLKEVNSGDTLYPALEIIDLEKVCDKGAVTTAVTIYNQRNELVGGTAQVPSEVPDRQRDEAIYRTVSRRHGR